MRKAGWLAGALVSCLCGGGWGGWLPGVWYRKHARCGGGPLRLLWSWWSAGGGCPCACLCACGVACCRGSGVVRPGCLACGSASLLWGGVVGVGGLVVNCIVDASIITVCFCDCGMRAFCLCVLSCFVVCFFERSVDALASGADEGRGGLRYSSGSRLAGCDPRVSEWGDPARVMSCHLHLNCIGCGG